MILKNADYKSLAKKIKEENKKVIVYGAGMIGQIIIPYIIWEYDLLDKLDEVYAMMKSTIQIMKGGKDVTDY